MRMAKKTWTHPIKSCCHPKMNIFSQRMTFDRGYPVINKRVSKLVTPPKKAHGRTKDKWQGMEIWSSQFETTFSSPLRLCSGWGLKSCECIFKHTTNPTIISIWYTLLTLFFLRMDVPWLQKQQMHSYLEIYNGAIRHGNSPTKNEKSST